MESIGFEHNSRVRVKNTLLVKKCSSPSEKHFALIKTGNVDNSVPFNANVKLSLNRVVYAIAHHLEVKSICFEHYSRIRVINTLLFKGCFSRSEKHFANIKTGKVDNLVPFNASV